MTMTSVTAEKVLSRLLLIVGGLAALAIFAVVMPTAWMEATSDRLGLGPFPHSTLTEYLTRSLSAMYALFGFFLIYIGCNVRRYLDLCVVMGWLTTLLGVALTGIDFTIGMPSRWAWGEGPPTIVVGLVIVWLAGKVERD